MTSRLGENAAADVGGQLVVGFDLDMTLIDSRPGIRATWDALAEQTGVRIDSVAAVERLGPPLSHEIAHWFAADESAAMIDRFRGLYPAYAIAPSRALPGARDALAAVRKHRGRSVIVTAKHPPNAQLHIEHLGLDVDEVVGSVCAEQKGPELAERSATIYVGDHVFDVAGARAAGALSVTVATGPNSPEQLRAAGADVVLADLTAFPDWLDEHLLSTRLDALQQRLSALDGVVVAFSGGADSAFLLAAAVRALGPDRVVAATAVSSSLAGVELAAAHDFAAGLKVVHLMPDTYEMDRDGYRANAGDRCYFCKAELLDVLAPLAAERGIATVATGTNADDAVAGFRPGIRAAAERGAITPLRDAGLSKAQVREASRRWGLPTWDKPAAACLSSRVAYGVTITPSRLARVERAEAAARRSLDEAGLRVADLRVRDLGQRARLEVDAVAVDSVRALPQVLYAVRAAGFAEVDIDPRGFRSGSMNELLPDPAPYR